MELGDIKKDQQNNERDFGEYSQTNTYLYDSELTKEILEDVKHRGKTTDDEIIYGVSDPSKQGLFDRINSFFIDHSRVTLKDKAYFFHLLGVMVESGIPVVQAVRSLAKHSENPKFRRVLATIAYNCDGGATLTEAMMRFSDVFDESELGVVRAGEASGKLNLMLSRLADELDKRHDLNMKIWAAAAYPIAVLSVLVIVAISMLVWILPTLLDLLKEGGVTNDKLPFATRVLIALQTGIVDYWWLILIIIFVIYGIFTMYKGTDRGAIKWDYAKLKFPVVGVLIRKVYVLRFVGVLGLLIESGLSVIKALQISGNSISNRVYKLKAQEIIENVKGGARVSVSMEDSEFLYPHEVVEMLRVGETSATLSSISQKVSKQYQKEVDNSLKKVMSVFEPVMILFVGLFVAVLALAIMAPIFNLNTIIK